MENGSKKKVSAWAFSAQIPDSGFTIVAGTQLSQLYLYVTVLTSSCMSKYAWHSSFCRGT